MLAERIISIYDLPSVPNRNSNTKGSKVECPKCDYGFTVTNPTWPGAHEPIGQACLWPKNWRWTDDRSSNVACALLSRQLHPESASQKIADRDFTLLGVLPKDFSPEVFRDIVGLYCKTVGGRLFMPLETAYGQAVIELRRTNAVSFRFGSWVSENSKLVVEWLSAKPRGDGLFFTCNPNCSWGEKQGEYLNSRFQILVADYLIETGIALPRAC